MAQLGYHIVGLREYPDHFAYPRAEVESLAQWAASLPVRAVVCTHKDLVKLGVDQLGQHPLWAVVVGLEITAGRPELEARLAAMADRIFAPNPDAEPQRHKDTKDR